MTARYVNLGCGSVFVESPEWRNLDFSVSSPAVQRANLLATLPLDSDTAQLVYSSHFLEHIPRPKVDGFLRECLRVLQPGGVLRLVLPDFEEMARSYLALRDAGDHARADFVVLEMIDQCVRRESGGELGRFFRILSEAGEKQTKMIEFVRERTGEELSAQHTRGETAGIRPQSSLLSRIGRVTRRRLQRAWVRLWLLGLPPAFRAQNVSLAAVGERHQWLWDFHQLRQALEATGFTAVERRTADSSAISGFPFHPLDLDAKGRPRKGAGSMYVEARKAEGRRRLSFVRGE